MANSGVGSGSGMYGHISGSEAFSDPQTTPIYNWKNFAPYFAPLAKNYRLFNRHGGEQDQLYQQYKDAYLGGTPDAAANAEVYQNYAKNLFANQPNQFNNYQQIGDYLYGKLDQFGNRIGQQNTAELNSRFAQLGIDPTHDLSAQRAVANRITNNLAPVFANTTNAIGRDYAGMNQADLQQTGLRLGLANQDALNQYMDRIYQRPLDASGIRAGEINRGIDQYGQLVDAYKRNIAGYQTKEGSDLAKYGAVFDRWANSYGGGNSTYPQQQQPMTNPYQQQISQNPYQQPMSAPQDQQWMNEYNGPYNYGTQSAPVGDWGTGYNPSGAYGMS